MAAVASRSSNTSPHLSSMSSPKRTLTVKHDDNQHKSSPLQRSQEARRATPPRQDAVSAAENSLSTADTKPGATSTATSAAQPLAPPPRPASDAPDYFNQQHSIFSTESNPFEHAFGGSSVDTPGKSLLPSVAALTSPSSLLPGGTPGWAGSLRSGPLSPAMLTGPTGQSDYFDPHFRGSFPTPNESSMRTGLTPGGGGSMFPAPSPNSQALFQQLQSGGATPSTLDFHRTAMSAAAQAKANNFSAANNPPATTQTSDPGVHTGMDVKQYQSAPAVQQPQADPFGQHDAEAANSLFLLTQSNGARTNGQFAHPAQQNHVQTNSHQMAGHMGTQSQETSPLSKRAPKNSISSITGSVDTGDNSDSGDDQQVKPATRSRGSKKGSASKPAAANNARRKASETPAKPPANKKTKVNSGIANQSDDDMMDSDDDISPKAEGPDGRKMTDEEKRKNFLERNRVAALKCRQRKKQWLANLQAKVEIFSAENDQLSGTVTQLREEIVNLKTLLLAHKDCAVSSQQGLQGNAMVAFVNGDMGQAPYGMGMPPPPNGMMLPVQGQMAQMGGR